MKTKQEKKRFSETYDGPEKKLEIQLKIHHTDRGDKGLRTIPVEAWKKVAGAGRAKIISVISTDALDAYLLSESSLFIWKDKLLMITCGDTSPVMAVPEIISLTGKDRISRIMYVKKINNHTNGKDAGFAKETETLERLFPGKHYHLASHDDNHMHFFNSGRGEADRGSAGITFQIYMHDFDNAVMKGFGNIDTSSAFPSELLPVFNKVIPHMAVDSHMFEPSGFSLNGIHKEQYLTMHVTPGREWSYVSFETNVFIDDYTDVVSGMVSFFKPQRVSVVLSLNGQLRDAASPPVLFRGSDVYSEREKKSVDLDYGGRVLCQNFSRNAPVEIIVRVAEHLFKDSNGSHDWEHTQRVVRMCNKIGKTEGAEMDVLTIAAYLHDIGRCRQDSSNGKICHAAAGSEMAETIIENLDITQEKKNNILHCIKSHRFRGQVIPETTEAKVLFDADKLDAMGAIGVARAYLFAGELGAMLHNPDNNIENTHPYSKDDTGYREYMVKLRKIKDKIMTDEGRRLAEERHSFMDDFFKRFLKEHNGEC